MHFPHPASIFGRILPGWLGDRAGRFNVMIITTFLTNHPRPRALDPRPNQRAHHRLRRPIRLHIGDLCLHDSCARRADLRRSQDRREERNRFLHHLARGADGKPTGGEPDYQERRWLSLLAGLLRDYNVCRVGPVYHGAVCAVWVWMEENMNGKLQFYTP